MSYRNPQIFFADPQALQKGFEAGFSSMQAKFEKERLEKERIAKEQDEALAGAYNASDLSGIANLDTRIMDGLQKSIDSIINDGSFATASASEQAKMIRQVSAVKNTVARLGELAGIDPEDWDSRNSPKLSALKSALTRGDESINIVGKGLDLKIVGDFGEITLDEIASAKFMNKTDFRDDYDKITSTFKKDAFTYMENAAKAGTEIDEGKLRNIFANIIKEQGDPEFWSYLFSNETDSTMKGRFYGDPEAKKVYGDDFESIQFTEMSDDLFKKVIGSVYDSAELRGYYTKKAKLAEDRLKSSQTKPRGTDLTVKMKSNAIRLKNSLRRLRSGTEGFLQGLSNAADNPNFFKEIDSVFVNTMQRLGFTHDKTGWTEGSEVNEYKFKYADGSPFTISPRDNISQVIATVEAWLSDELEANELRQSEDGVRTFSGNIYT